MWAWAGFLFIVGVILALDLGVLNRHAHVVRMREALAFTAFTIVLAAVFAGVLYFAYNGQRSCKGPGWFDFGIFCQILEFHRA